MIDKSKIISYFKEVSSEVKRIHWPKKNEVINLTFIVIIIIIIISFVLGFFDILARNLIFLLFKN